MHQLIDLRDRNSVTCEEMGTLLEEGAQFRKNLHICAKDLALIQNGIRLTCALDFSDLHSYLWPQRSPSGNHALFRKLLKSRHFQFTLTPGATIELFRYLERILGGGVNQASAIRRKLDRPIASGLDSTLNEIRAIGPELASLIHSALRIEPGRHDEISSILTGLERYEQLIRQENFVEFHEVLERGNSNIKADPDVYKQSILSLSLRRPGEPHNNNIDAHNYALLYSLSTSHSRSRESIYYLVTSSRIPYEVFYPLRWGVFPKNVPNPKAADISLVRKPVHLCYLGLLLDATDSPSRVLNGMCADLDYFLKTWTNLSAYKQYLKATELANPTTLVPLPTNARYIRRFLSYTANYHQCFGLAREAIETDLLAEENTRYMRGVGAWSIAVPGSANEHSMGRMYSGRALLQLLDRLQQTTLRTLKRLRKTLSTIPEDLLLAVDLDGVIVGGRAMQTAARENLEFNCWEIECRRPSDNRVCFNADVYADYFVAHWPARVTFAEFVDSVTLLVANARSLTGSPVAPRLTSGEKEFSGIYFFSTSKPPTIVPLEEVPDLNPEELMDFANLPKESIQSVRIALPEGDLCYEFDCQELGGPRVAVLTHCLEANSVASFVYATTRLRMPLRQIRKALELAREKMQSIQKRKVRTSRGKELVRT